MRTLVALLAAGLTLQAGLALAQDMNDSPFQVGARSALMGGAAVGGVRDSSAVFYNPGALAFVAEPGVSLSANAFRYGRLTVRDALGSQQALDDDLYDVVPVLIAGSGRLGAGNAWSFGYALVTRQQFSTSFRGAVTSVTDVPAVGLPGDETFLGQFDDAREVRDFWGMAVASRRVTDRLAIGGGPIVGYREESRRQRLSTNLQNATTTPPTPVFQLTSFFDATFFQLSLLGRFGIAWQPTAALGLGATVTTPGLELYGEGEEQAEIVLASRTGDLDLRSLQQDLDTNHRIPFRAAVGAEAAVSSRWSVGITVEYVDRLEGKPVIEPDPGGDFFRGTPQFVGDSPALRLVDRRQAVVNVAVGAEYRIDGAYSAYLGFWTDFSPIDIDDSKALLEMDQLGTPVTASAVDVYNAVVGFARRTKERLVAIGVTGAYGTGRVAGNLDFVGPEAIRGGGSLPAVVERKATFWSTALLLSFTQFF